MTPLESALRDLADDISDTDVPADLAERSWRAAHPSGVVAGARSSRWRRLGPALLAAAAVIVMVAWLLSPSGLGTDDGAPAGTNLPLGYPQRVAFDRDPDPLPPDIGRVSGLLQVPATGDLVDQETTWLAYGSDGRVWRIDDSEALPRITRDGEAPDSIGQTFQTTPALSGDGRRIAVIRQTGIAEGSARTDLRSQLDILDLQTGERAASTTLCGTASCHPSALSWDAEGERLAVLTDSALLVLDPSGTVLTTIPLAEESLQLGDTLTLGLAGWTREGSLLLVASDSAGRDSVLRVFTVDAASGAVQERAPQRPPEWFTSSPEGESVIDYPLTTEGDGFAVLDPDGGGSADAWTPQWVIYTDLDDAQPVGAASRVACCPSVRSWTKLHLWTSDGRTVGTGSTADGRTDDPREGTWVVEGHLGEGQPSRVFTVVDPAFSVSDLVIAEDSLSTPGASSAFGTSTWWPAWHPVESALIGAGALLGLVWLGMRWRRSRPLGD